MSDFMPEAPVTLDAAPDASGAPEPASVGEALTAEPAAPVAEPQTTTLADPGGQGGLDPREVQAELDYLRTQNEGLLERINQYTQPQPQQPGQQPQGFDTSMLFDEYGQFNPEAFVHFQTARDQALLQSMQQTVQEMFGPIGEQLTAQRQAETASHYEGLVESSFAADVARNGALVPEGSPPEAAERAREFVEERAGAYLGEFNQRFGTNPDGSTKPQVLEMAIERASADVRSLLGTARQAGTQQQASHLATLAGAPAEPGAGAAGAGSGPPAFRDVKDVVAYYSRNGAGFPQG